MVNRFAPFSRITDKNIDFSRKKEPSPGRRIYILPFILTILALLLLGRLFQLTIVRGTYFRTVAENNRIREVVIPGNRADIVDRLGMVIASTKKSERTYVDGEANAHYIGYIQSADKTDLDQDACKNKLRSGDVVGKKGIEKVYECSLRPINGKKLVEVNSQELPIKTLSVIAPVQQPPLRVALDSYVQKKAYDIVLHDKDVVGKKVSIIATKPATGEIIAMLSIPTFDPNAFINKDNEKITQYLTDKTHPLFNRVLQGAYPPGSVFKTAVAAGALQEKKIDDKYIVNDEGSIKAGPLTFGNWYFLQYGKTEGPVDIIKAIRRSNDIFFYKVGALLGDQAMKKWAEIFGYGQKSGIKMSEEVTGSIPSAFWKHEVMQENWYLGDTYNMSIGQGYTLVTPLQVNMANAVFANGGNLCKPKLLYQETPECHSLKLEKETLELIREGMKGACSTGGTGWPFFDFKASGKPIQVACKTGTAESHALSGLPHAWISAFAPYENPEIMVTVMVEESGEGSTIAGPIARDIMKAYFERSE